MTALALVFGTAALLAVLTSAIAARSPLSTSAVFLVTGLVAGPLGFDLVDLDDHVVERTAEIALFTILFTDGQHAPWREVRRRLGAPARALLLAMPLTFAIIAAAGHFVVGLPWLVALVLAAVLAPTDPVFASALVGREDVPARVRNLLNVESGLNDGLALPAVLVLVGVAGGAPENFSTDPGILVVELAAGAAVGIALPVLIWLLLRIPGVGAVASLRPLGPLACAVLLFGICEQIHANQFLAAFLAGATIATLAPDASETFRPTGELVSEMVKGAALIAFASLVDLGTLGTAGWAGVILAGLVILVARPAPIVLTLVGTRLTMAERLSVAWFGPKGFASVAYAVIVAFSGMDMADDVLALTTVVVLASIVAHSSTDVTVARRLSTPPA
ncbi:sodium:proton antiporter [Aeromicrobium phragmitis]|uniref:Sodium:proton antiporter n=1 Tax=Aeromicrobium phragmitis TaxID=2478914 RepID=A0A3L8PQD1_9ACTN|nr:cation:proton antiporter [Aeromicrobium phragmitis]RLV57530.1 sodium:proton antiporter [Aeromicrobium phragmitis]